MTLKNSLSTGNFFFNTDKAFHEKLKVEFIKNRTFIEQFEGINNFRFKPQKTATLIYKIYGVYFEESQKKTIEDVFFFSSKSKKLNKMKAQGQFCISKYFEEEGNFSLAAIKVKYRSESWAENYAKKKINNVLKRLNVLTNYNCFIDKKDVIITQNFNISRCGVSYKSFGKTKNFDGSEFKKMVKNSILDLPIKSVALDTLKELEFLYESARLNKSLETYWQYLETLNRKVFKTDIPSKMIKSIPCILVAKYQYYLSSHIRRYVHSCKLNDYSILGLPDTEYNNLRKIENLDLELIKNKTPNNFLRDLLDFHSTELNKNNLTFSYNYYKNIISQLYEYRNSITHSGDENKNLSIKLEKIIPMIVSIYRAAIIDAINKNRRLPLDRVIQSIEGKSKTKHLN